MESLAEYKAKIAALKRAHELMIYQQDLSFEVAPRDSRFSATLLDLMKREETLARDPTSPAAATIIAKVDDQLFAETQQFFAKVINSNNKKWDSLRQNLSKEIQAMKKRIATRFRQEDIANAAALANSSSAAGGAPADAPDEKDLLAQEEERLLVDYYKNWHQYEIFHLQEAFASQMARIDRDWSVHETNLRKDYDEKRELVTGKMPSPTSSSGHTSDESAPSPNGKKWHHPEKQKALIHTAPVFSPTVAGSGRNASASKRSEKGIASVAAELQRLDRDFQDAMQNLQRQKADAKKWLHRQQLRLSAQCEEVQREKAVMADLYESEYQDIRRMLEVVRKGSQALAIAESSNQRQGISRTNRGSIDSNASSNPDEMGGFTTPIPTQPTPLAASLRQSSASPASSRPPKGRP